MSEAVPTEKNDSASLCFIRLQVEESEPFLPLETPVGLDRWSGGQSRTDISGRTRRMPGDERTRTSFVVAVGQPCRASSEDSKPQRVSWTTRKISDAIVRRVADLRWARGPDARVLLGLVGGPGSGKTTACEVTRARVESDQVGGPGRPGVPLCAVLPMDGFHFPRDVLDRFPNPELAHRRRGAPFTFDAEGFLRVLRKARARDEVWAPAFSHHKGDPKEDAIVIDPETRVVLVEGNYLLLNEKPWSEVRGLLDEVLFLDTPLPLAMSRLVRRHMRALGISEMEAIERVATNDRLNAELVLRCKRRADYILDIRGGARRPKR